jgi:hypothetical protein
MARLVNRSDVWGGYVDEADREKVVIFANGQQAKLGQTLTRPAVRQRGKVFLTTDILVRHFRARSSRDVIGLHTTSPENTSKWGGPEVDWHSPDSTAPAVNLAAALAWYEKLVRLGFHPLLSDSNGVGGYHGPLMLFRDPVPTPKLFRFIEQIVSDHVQHGIPNAPETFPKQAQIPGDRFGNWLRLPGRHHTRAHWSRVWDGSRWLEDNPAIDFIIALSGDSPALLPDIPKPPPAPARCIAPFASRSAGNLDTCISAYMAKLPNLSEGQGRDDIAFNFAAFLIRDLALSDEVALTWLERWDGGNNPPKGRERLAAIIRSAHQYGQRPIGCGLSSARPRPPRARVRAKKLKPGHSMIAFSVEVM